jgi:uncharacterized damage-inducible protein DinB
MASIATTIAPETLVTIRNMMVGSLKSEFATTKKVLANLKDGEWKPDPHARTGPEIAWHIVSNDVWFLDAIADLSCGAPPSGSGPATVAEMLTWYDREFPRAVARVEKMNATQLAQIVDFFGMKMPAYTLLSFDLVHTVHHRGQLATYLRPLGGKCPDIYGGSYDEPWQA